ncbi:MULTISPECIES: sugar ABC transporter permease [Streptomyces]|uniref:sugar ABC transporter permease n=1 Tax=Streptomyces TaxID=1883 RepID=UPI000CD4A66C|nr:MULTISPECIES: sugar ABC transporter permease [Streptomyces]
MTAPGAPRWAGHALDGVLARVAATEADVGERFPLYADPADGRWTSTRRGSWTGGFWAGLLWLRAGRTGEPAHQRAAADRTRRLGPWADADTVTRGLILWYGTAAGRLPGAGPDARAAAELRARAATACLAAVDARLGIVPWGGALGGPRLLARADGVPGMVPLLAAAGPDGAAAAAAHLDAHLALCLGGEEVLPAWRFDEETARWQACASPAPGWSRGRAWLLLAVADALLRPEVLRNLATPLDGTVDRLLVGEGLLTGPLVPPADHARRDGPRDTSAAAITAVALLKLAQAPGRPEGRYTERATRILARLVHRHLSGGGTGRPSGMLLDGCYEADRGLAARHEVIWGDYFLALGLATLVGAVDLTRT